MLVAHNKETRRSSKSPLGTDRKNGVHFLQIPAPPDDENPTEFRFRLQRLARSCWGNHDHRLEGCCIRPLPHAFTIDVVRNPSTNTAHFQGLEQCSRVWTCPVCAQRITNQRREELSYGLAAATKQGLTAVLVTYTLRHKIDDPLKDLLGALQASVRAFKSGRGYQDIKHEYGIIGGIKALEITYGENGWHPHIHELLFLDVDPAHVNFYALHKWLADRWIAQLQKHGYDASFEHGLDVRTADSAIADYIAKWGREPRERTWGAEHEIAGAPIKKAHRDGLTPFQLLEALGGPDQRRAWVLFQEYAGCMENKRQLVWSPGLRARLAMPDELPDEQLPLFDDVAENYVIMEISREEWKRCCIYDMRAQLLGLCAAGATEALRAVIARRDIWAVIHEPPEPSAYQYAHGLPANILPANTEIQSEQLKMPGIGTVVQR